MNDIIFIFTVFGDDFLPKLETFRVDKDIFIILDYYLINLIDYGYLIDKKELYKINTKIWIKIRKIRNILQNRWALLGLGL